MMPATRATSQSATGFGVLGENHQRDHEDRGEEGCVDVEAVDVEGKQDHHPECEDDR